MTEDLLMEEAVKLEAELGDFTNQLAETY